MDAQAGWWSWLVNVGLLVALLACTPTATPASLAGPALASGPPAAAPALTSPEAERHALIDGARREAQDILYEENASDSHLVPGSRSLERIAALQQAGVQFALIDVDFVQRQGEAEFNRRRARAQEILQKR